MEFNESEFLIETIVPENELIISRTDLRGFITYANETFAQISGYLIDELVGNPHNLVRHPDMPKRVFKQMWETLLKGQKWEGVVKNLRKDRGYYWVHATISGVYKDGKLIEYKSIRTPIDYQTKLKHQKLYDEYRNLDNENIRRVIYT
ncbi:PAS domain-containing protein [Halarcobacter ebronensis]|uniref:Chemotaxis protein n=1 Tax=Halarcobacter ebronensis TaxID=1462615 RepID=A0A4Q1AF23_9BACT|nr:PAS domain-containing protein [Halarcobacter ebronensis]QKF82675.1 PAS sensor-containing signal transduction protein [Halarcobacter ebronensis]RXK02097.1 chemotaxis protein [Halarcobacter ebronensis]